MQPTHTEDIEEQKHYGLFRAKVKDVDDPLKQGRIRAWIPALMPGNENDEGQWSNWCEPKHAPGGTDGDEDRGAIFVPPVDSRVWIEFEQGNTDYPVYDGGYYREGSSKPPLRSRESGDAVIADLTVAGVTVAGGVSNAPTYPLNKVLKTPRGIIVEIDDTSTSGRVRVQMPSGAFIEFSDDGAVLVRSANGQKVQLGAGSNVELAATNVVLAVSSLVRAGSASSATPLVMSNPYLTLEAAVMSALSTFAAAVGTATGVSSAALTGAISSFVGGSYATTKLNSE